MNCKSIYLEKNHLKWAAILVLFLSLFTFSSNQANSITLQSNPAFQTEWVSGLQKSFSTSSVFTKSTRKTDISIKEHDLQISAFNELVRIKLRKLAKAFLPTSNTPSFFVQETISQYPAEIPAS
jgi:predicted membrane metal-binding protein